MYENEAEIHRALGDPLRLHILALLRVREACVCELVTLLPISQPAVSQHLRKLRQAGIVFERRQKYWNYYAIRDDLPTHIEAVIRDLPHPRDGEAWLLANHVDDACSTLPAATANHGAGARPMAAPTAEHDASRNTV